MAADQGSAETNVLQYSESTLLNWESSRVVNEVDTTAGAPHPNALGSSAVWPAIAS
jgi:hypothetical protein